MRKPKALRLSLGWDEELISEIHPQPVWFWGLDRPGLCCFILCWAWEGLSALRFRRLLHSSVCPSPQWGLPSCASLCFPSLPSSWPFSPCSISSHLLGNVSIQLVEPRESLLGRAWRTTKNSPILFIFSRVRGLLRPCHNCVDLQLPHLGPASLGRELPCSHPGLGPFQLPRRSSLGHQAKSFCANNLGEAPSISWPRHTWEYAVRNSLLRRWKTLFPT